MVPHPVCRCGVHRRPFDRRYVLTTRKDGSMRIDASADALWTRKPAPAPSLNLGVGGLAPLGLGDNVLAALFTPPSPRSGLAALPYLDDPLARALGLGAFLDPIPQKR